MRAKLIEILCVIAFATSMGMAVVGTFQELQKNDINDRALRVLSPVDTRNQWGHKRCDPYYNGWEYVIPTRCVK